MIAIGNNPSNDLIGPDTVSGPVGLCYFDAATESILELQYGNGYVISVDPHEEVLTKLYLIAKSGSNLSRVLIRLVKDGVIDDMYSAKLIIGQQMPSNESFGKLPEFNGFSILQVPENELISVWIKIDSKIPVNQEIDLDIVVHYE